MTTPPKRRKQPERLRRRLLDVAADIVSRQGPADLTLDAVATRSSVSKGGLLHHFPTKQALLDVLADDLIAAFDRLVEEAMADDAGPAPFTRAYLRAVAAAPDEGAMQVWMVLSAFEPRLRARWDAWLRGRLERHAGADLGEAATIVRLAADGICLNDMFGVNAFPRAGREAVLARLLAMLDKEVA